MNWRLNTGWKYPFAKTQEEWDAMTDRAAEEVKIGTTGTLRCVVIEMNGISPGEVTVRVEDSSYDGCLVSVHPDLIRQRALAAVPPPPPSDGTPVDHLRAALDMQASPTIDRGDSHGARGQKGWIVWESSLALVAASLAAVPPAPPSKCHVCGEPTQYACSDCAINFAATVYVCTKPACRDEHECKCAGDSQRQAARAAPASIIRCEHCDNGIETAWEYCAWCGQFLKGDVEVEERFVSRKGDSAETAYRDGVRAAVNAYEQGMTASEIRARVAAPPSIPEREKVVEGRFAESNYRADLWWESLSEDERKAARAAAIAALEGK